MREHPIARLYFNWPSASLFLVSALRHLISIYYNSLTTLIFILIFGHIITIYLKDLIRITRIERFREKYDWSKSVGKTVMYLHSKSNNSSFSLWVFIVVLIVVDENVTISFSNNILAKEEQRGGRCGEYKFRNHHQLDTYTFAKILHRHNLTRRSDALWNKWIYIIV